MATQLASLDRTLVQIADGALTRARERGGEWLMCRRGCTECCIGPFPITALDAWRLQRGLERLATTDAERAARVLDRARGAVRLMIHDFPGDAVTGRLAEDEAREQAFAEKFHAVPCPALNPADGGCDLYAWRPINCRTYGPPVSIDGEDLPSCHLCFVGAKRRDVERARVSCNLAAAERAALEALGEQHSVSGDTIVAFALTKEDRIPTLDFSSGG